MTTRESQMDKIWFEFKSNWESVEYGIYHEHPENRIGDEIQTTAMMAYLKHKGLEIDYRDACQKVSAAAVFPSEIVRFVRGNERRLPKFDPLNLWVWAPFLRDEGFYTSSNSCHSGSQARYDCVFCPCLKAEYNEDRELSPANALEVFKEIRRHWPNSLMVIDKAKASLVQETDGVFASDNIHTTFRIIELSHMFVGCDTGTSHYAGAICHPRMTLLYPDEEKVFRRIYWQHQMLSWVFSRPELLRYKASSLPCCDPKNFRVLRIRQNTVEPSEVTRAVQLNA